MTTVYVLTFDASWIDWVEGRKLVTGTIDYPVTTLNGALDVTEAILACQIIAAEIGTILYPENGVAVKTHTWDIGIDPLWQNDAVRVY